MGAAVRSAFHGAVLKIKKTLLGTTPGGSRIDQFTMINGNGLSVSLMTYGGILMSVKTPVNLTIYPFTHIEAG